MKVIGSSVLRLEGHLCKGETGLYRRARACRHETFESSDAHNSQRRRRRTSCRMCCCFRRPLPMLLLAGAVVKGACCPPVALAPLEETTDGALLLPADYWRCVGRQRRQTPRWRWRGGRQAGELSSRRCCRHLQPAVETHTHTDFCLYQHSETR